MTHYDCRCGTLLGSLDRGYLAQHNAYVPQKADSLRHSSIEFRTCNPGSRPFGRACQHFTVDWFSHNISTWIEVFQQPWLVQVFRRPERPWRSASVDDEVQPAFKDSDLKGLATLQVGCWEGPVCMLATSECAAAAQASTLVCIDTWAGAEQYGSSAQAYASSCHLDCTTPALR